MNFVNYHRHSSYSNIITPDSPVTNRDYAARVVELGHTVLSGVEHGWAGRYLEGYTLAKEYGLKFLFGTEAYIVKDRSVKDATNAHIVLLARNEKGRRTINRALSAANTSGFYYKARIDLELLFSLSPTDVWVTSACVGGLWKYEDAEEIILRIAEHFGRSFFLEVQYHKTPKQVELNAKILEMSKRYDLQIIAGCDSHYIYPDQFTLRDDFLASKHVVYEDEDGWYMDYPDGEEVLRRFHEQGVLNAVQAKEALDNTRIFESVEEYDCACFDTEEIKMPSIYPDIPITEREKILYTLVWDSWQKEKGKIDQSLWHLYEEEIRKELSIICSTNHADYFLLNHEVVNRGKKNGGVLTFTGRGSGVSFYVNFLLGFTRLDRIAAPVRLFPERFMSAERMLQAKSLADFDFNTANPEPFYMAQKELLGEERTYPMVAYGTMKTLAAWKAYARSQNVDFDVANAISDSIHEYEMESFRAKEDDEDAELDPHEYIPQEYWNMFDASRRFLNTVVDAKIHPCAYLVYPGNIVDEIGLIRVKENICCVMDGLWAEATKCMKNDLLTVAVVDVIDRVFKQIGVEPFDVNELMRRCDGDERVWAIYKNAWTKGINQVERHGTASRVSKFSPANLAELSAFVAAIRPGFKSYYKQFEAREPFEYGVPALDNLIQTREYPFSYMLYQENAMAVLAFAGIPVSETYEIIKNIAKKRAEKVIKYKQQFLTGMKKRLGDMEDEDASKIADDTWQVIEDSSRYSFNAAHALSVAADSLYGAYLKSHHTLDFYVVFLKMLEESGEKDRLAETKDEAERAYGIQFPPLRFGQDNREIVADVENNSISSSMKSLKGFGHGIAEDLYALGLQKYDDFVDFLVAASESGAISKKFEALIKISYFSCFGGNKKVWDFFVEFTTGDNRYSKTLKPATKVKRLAVLKDLWYNMPDAHFPLLQQIEFEKEYAGGIKAIYPHVDKRFVYVLEVNEKYAPRVLAYSLATGKVQSLKIYNKVFLNQPVRGGDVLYCKHFEHKPSVKYVDGAYVENEDGEMTWWLSNYIVVDDFDKLMEKNG